ncbi:hypothetical protein [Alkalibacillus silvisoli]|uniref:Uncharacterized protein n=1 Tax=Alkalibacillus silvisoli TaxID=392823 RepID=A0ABN0ZK98_9BACI
MSSFSRGRYTNNQAQEEIVVFLIGLGKAIGKQPMDSKTNSAKQRVGLK